MLSINAKITPDKEDGSFISSFKLPEFKLPIFNFSNIAPKISQSLSSGLLELIAGISVALSFKSIGSNNKLSTLIQKINNSQRTGDPQSLQEVLHAGPMRFAYRDSPAGTSHMFALKYLTSRSHIRSVVKHLNPDKHANNLGIIFKRFRIAAKRENRFQALYNHPLPTLGLGKYKNYFARRIRNIGYYLYRGKRSNKLGEEYNTLFSKVPFTKPIGNFLIKKAVPMLNKISNSIPKVSAIFSKLLPVVFGVISVVALLNPLLKGFIDNLGFSVDSLTSQFDISMFQLKVLISQELSDAMVYFVMSLVNLFDKLIPIIMFLLVPLSDFINTIGYLSYTIGLVIGILYALSDVTTFLMYSWVPLGVALTEVFIDIGNFLKENFDKIWDYFKTKLSIVTVFVTSEVGLFFEALGDLILYGYDLLMSKTIGSKTNPKFLKDLVDVRNRALDVLNEAQKEQKENYNKNVNPIIDSFVNHLDVIEDKLDSFTANRKKDLDLILEKAELKEKAKEYDIMMLRFGEMINRNAAEYEYNKKPHGLFDGPQIMVHSQ